ncbi:hypothetical protein CUJ84_Chr000743 [Rhizobium leguminosarum]|uniref:Uncharacterized protein n=1 Tax=Rhizobium leguminosarum TaxID=384 RepID=A0A2K9YYW6_RHILE|nr:hypothetical protein CUJ84_Chr000743 [Rhizobium leguminosarum]
MISTEWLGKASRALTQSPLMIVSTQEPGRESDLTEALRSASGKTDAILILTHTLYA